MKKSEKGSLLIFAVWVLIVMTIFSIAIGFRARQKLRFLQTLENRDTLRSIAMAGVKKAIFVLQRDSNRDLSHNYLGKWSHSEDDFKDVSVGEGKFSVLYDWQSRGETVRRYGIIDEGSKLNVNRVDGKVLRTLFTEAAGLDTGTAEHLASAIVDFRDEDDVMTDTNGAETRYYRSLTPPYLPKNSDYEALEELYYVKGVTPEVYQKISPYLTVTPTGSVNINTASEGVFLALGFSRQLKDEIMTYRLGSDRTPATEDDGVIHNLGSFADKLENGDLGTAESVSEEFKQQMNSGDLGTKSVYFKVFSEGSLRGRKEAIGLTCTVSIMGRVVGCLEEFYTLKEVWGLS